MTNKKLLTKPYTSTHSLPGPTNHAASVPSPNTQGDLDCVGSAVSCVNAEKLVGGRLNITTQQQPV